MKLKKLLSLTAALAIVFTTFSPINVNAQVSENNGIEVDLGNFYYHIPNYNESDVIIENVVDNKDNYVVNIVDEESGTILEQITCKPVVISELEKNINFNAINPATTDYYTIQRDVIDPIVTVRLSITVRLYKSGSSSSIQSVTRSSINAISSSSATLEDTYAEATSATGSFPTTHLQYYGTGTITVKTDITSTGEMSIGVNLADVLEYGYSYSLSGSTTIYLRKPVTIQGDFYTYSQN